MEIMTSVKLQAYYQDSLSKNEKSQLLRYLIQQFDYSYSSLQQKMTGKAEFNKRDLILIGEVINSKSWKA